jgi:hypothetical protein
LLVCAIGINCATAAIPSSLSAAASTLAIDSNFASCGS